MLESFTNISAKSTIFETYQTSLPVQRTKYWVGSNTLTEKENLQFTINNNSNFEIENIFPDQNVSIKAL